jgi:hemoglobin-like flavoprotein
VLVARIGDDVEQSGACNDLRDLAAGRRSRSIACPSAPGINVLIAALRDEFAMDIQGSVGKILQRGEVMADLFYITLLDRYPQVRAYFAGVDLRRQAVLLTMALKLVEQYYVHHYPALQSYLKVLGDRHRERLNIPAEMFAPFGDCLLVTIREFHGSEWDKGLEDQWREAIDEAIAVMLEDEGKPHTS